MHMAENEDLAPQNPETPVVDNTAAANAPALDNPPNKGTDTPAVRNGPVGWLSKTWGKAAVVGGVLLAIANLPGLFNSSVEEVGNVPKSVETVQSWWANDDRYRGQWTNDVEGIMEGGLTGLNTRPQPQGIAADQGSVSIELNTDRGEVSGMISSRTIVERRIHTFMFLSGESSSDGIAFNVWDYFNGQPIVFAQLVGEWKRVDGEERLVFRTLKQATDIFPDDFYVWRGGSLPPNALNEDLLRELSESACADYEPAPAAADADAVCKVLPQLPPTDSDVAE
jgi:hypothetical protein